MVWLLLFFIVVIAIWSEVISHKEKKYGKNYEKKSLNVDDVIVITENIGKKQDKFFKDLKVGMNSAFKEFNRSLEESRIEQKKEHERKLDELINRDIREAHENMRRFLLEHPEAFSKKTKYAIKSEKKLSKKQQEIKEYVDNRGIDKLIHFTQYKNIESILEHGLKTRSDLDKLNTKYYFNDHMRLDKRQNSISLSITYPNSQMLWKYSQNEHCIILVLDPSILWEYDCAFCYTNAATTDITKAPLENLTSIDALKLMFKGEHINRKLGSLKKKQPTDIQAEVLVLNNIPINKIKEIHLSPDNKNYELEVNNFVKNTGIKIKINEHFFQWMG
jgi:hypothetical protein